MYDLVHIRTQALAAAMVVLQTCPSVQAAGAQRVWLDGRGPFQPQEVPAFIVGQGKETSHYLNTEGVRKLVRCFEIYIKAVDKVADDIIPKLNSLAAEAEAVMKPPQIVGSALNIGETDLRIVRTDQPGLQEGSNQIGEMSIWYEVTVGTVENDATQSMNSPPA